MSSIVLELQNEVTSRDCDIVNVLRKAHLIAVKLNLTEFDKWLSCELNGYTGSDIIPDYRKVQGVLQGLNPLRGWIYAIITDPKMESEICCCKISISISEIKSLYEKGDNSLIRELPSQTQIFLNNCCSNGLYETQFRVELSSSAIGDILEKVKNTVWEWTIKLEKEGILGEGMLFNSTEKETAKRIPQAVNNYYGSNINVINGPVNNSPVIAGNENSIAFSYEKAKEIITEIERSLDRDNLSTKDRTSAIEILTEIRENLFQRKKPNVIEAAFERLKDFLIGVGASATVALVQAKMQGLF